MAVLLDDAVRAALGAASERLRARTRSVAWVAAENLHVTLKFLGSLDEARVPAVTASLAEAAAGATAFDAVVEGLGAFPSLARPRVIWAGMGEGGRPMAELAARVDAALAPLGFPREPRDFAPHVTLGRVRAPRRDPDLAEALAAGARSAFGTLRVDRIALMRSDLSPRGARYTELAACPLAV